MKFTIVSNGNEMQKDLLVSRIRQRIPFSKSSNGLKISLRIDEKVGPADSYKISATNGEYTITGADSRGLSYGIGKFLRTATWEKNAMIPNPPVTLQKPDCSFRAMYFAIHCYNWYHRASIEELEEYCKDMLLMGYNIIIGIVPVLNMKAFDDEDGKNQIEKNLKIFRLCRKFGLNPGLIVCVNQGLRFATPDDILADDSFSYDAVTGKTIRPRAGKNVCLSNPKGYEYMRWIFDNEMKAFTETGLDYIVSFPYDEGGCGCEKCSPWGANGYVTGCRLLNEVAKSYYPNCKFIAPTWMFDVGTGEKEYEGFYERLRTDAQFIDEIMVDAHDQYPRYPLEHELLRPVVGFPEISMWGLYPWGGYGANPMPERFQKIWDTQKPISDGGMPYSEGIYEDILKFQFAGYYWDKERTYEDILKEYANFEYGSRVAKDAVTLMVGIGKNHANAGYRQQPDYELAKQMKELAYSINKKLPSKTQKYWRWRILFIRAILDVKRYGWFVHHNMKSEQELHWLRRYSSDWLLGDKEAQKYMKELTKIYHALDHDNGYNRWTRPVYGFGTIMHDKVDRGAEASQ